MARGRKTMGDEEEWPEAPGDDSRGGGNGSDATDAAVEGDIPADVTGQDAPYAWTCACGWEMPTYGRDKEWIPPLRHLGLKDGQQHKIAGLMDRSTGELVLRGLDSTGFQRMFHVGRFSPEREQEREQTKQGTSRPAGGGGGKGNVRDFPGRRLRVLAQDVEVSDLISLALHLVARRLPELVPPELLATEAGYAQALAKFLEDCVIVTLSALTQAYPDRFSAADLNMAIITSEAQKRLQELGS